MTGSGLELASLSVAQIQGGLRKKQFSAREIAEASLHFAASENSKTNAFLTFCPERALAAAARADAALAKGEDPGRWPAFPWP